MDAIRYRELSVLLGCVIAGFLMSLISVSLLVSSVQCHLPPSCDRAVSTDLKFYGVDNGTRCTRSGQGEGRCCLHGVCARADAMLGICETVSLCPDGSTRSLRFAAENGSCGHAAPLLLGAQPWMDGGRLIYMICTIVAVGFAHVSIVSYIAETFPYKNAAAAEMNTIHSKYVCPNCIHTPV